MMPPANRVSTSLSTLSTPYPTNTGTTSSHVPRTPRTLAVRRRSTGRPRTRQRPRTAASTIGGIEVQRIICAVSEARGISPTVGLAFVNLDTAEASLCQICDSQTYVRTLHKLMVYEPSMILIMSTAANPKSKMYSIIEENIDSGILNVTDRKYWTESTGLEQLRQLAAPEDVESTMVAVEGNYFAVCCFAAVLRFIELDLQSPLRFHRLRIKYESSEGCMMIDLATTRSLELIQNLQDPKSKSCLFGLLKNTLTPMGSRALRSSILQPLTEQATLEARLDGLEELTTKEEMFHSTRQGMSALQGFLDVDRLLTSLIIIPTKPTLVITEQAINNVIILKQFVTSVNPVYEALTGATSDLLVTIRDLCRPGRVDPIIDLIKDAINDDITYQSKPLDLRNQRTYAVKAGVNGFLDVARQTFKEATADAFEMVERLKQEHGLTLDLKYDNQRQFYMGLPVDETENQPLPPVFINCVRRKRTVECQTLDLIKQNQKIHDCHVEVLLLSDKVVQELIDKIRGEISVLFKIAEGLALLDMIASFAQLVTTQALHEYVRPRFSATLAIENGRHPIKETMHDCRFVPNDIYATEQTRFQIITGCNMSGKSTYIRSVALMTVMAQIGCFIPAKYATFPIRSQLFARVSIDDNTEANISTFAAEMREAAFIMRNVDAKSLIIIDELGRATSTCDGLAIALSIAEALVQSKALVWFATHFTDLARIMAERTGVVNLHLATELVHGETMTMLYKIAAGHVADKHYGLMLARTIDFPPSVIEVATQVSNTITSQGERRKRGSGAYATAKRRKAIFALRENLIQARDGAMKGKDLAAWLKKLQDDFVMQMDAITTMASADEELDSDEVSSTSDGSAVISEVG